MVAGNLLLAAATAASPVLEMLSRVTTRVRLGRHDVYWSNRWDSNLEDALVHLLPDNESARDLYRMLAEPTSVRKRHAVVFEHAVPVAAVSLRRRRNYWEPVSYQCAPPGMLAASAGEGSLGRSLGRLGVEIRVGSGVRIDPAFYEPTSHQDYEAYEIDLSTPFGEIWPKHHRKRVKAARSQCEHMTTRVDGQGDVDWIVDRWQEMWARDPGNEVVAAEDRKRAWNWMASSAPEQFPKIHSLVLVDGSSRMSGTIVCRAGDTAHFLCTARAALSDHLCAGTAVLASTVDWAQSIGIAKFDLGGGSQYKQWWGQPAGHRSSLTFRPPVIEFAYRSTSAARRLVHRPTVTAQVV